MNQVSRRFRLRNDGLGFDEVDAELVTTQRLRMDDRPVTVRSSFFGIRSGSNIECMFGIPRMRRAGGALRAGLWRNGMTPGEHGGHRSSDRVRAPVPREPGPARASRRALSADMTK